MKYTDNNEDEEICDAVTGTAAHASDGLLPIWLRADVRQNCMHSAAAENAVLSFLYTQRRGRQISETRFSFSTALLRTPPAVWVYVFNGDNNTANLVLCRIESIGVFRKWELKRICFLDQTYRKALALSIDTT